MNVVLRDAEPGFDWERGALEFRLTWEGELLSETPKQEIRKAFLPQLEELWRSWQHQTPKPKNKLKRGFVPLITKDMELSCRVDVLFLLRDHNEDIDNRLKNLFDALSIPRELSQVGEPFFCLLEDDSIITKATVETDTLLRPSTSKDDALLIVTIRLAIY